MIAKEIKKLLLDNNIKQAELAKKCNWTQSNLYGKLKRDNFCESDLIKIANSFGCDLRIEFVPKNSGNTEDETNEHKFFVYTARETSKEDL